MSTSDGMWRSTSKKSMGQWSAQSAVSTHCFMKAAWFALALCARTWHADAPVMVQLRTM